MHKAFLIFMLFWMTGATLSAQGEPDLQAERDRFREGRRTWNGPAMERARTGFSAAARRFPGMYTPLYWQSVSEFYLLLFYGLEDSAGFDPDKAEALLDSAEKTMKAAISIRPQEAECRAMLSSVAGFRIVMHPFSAVWNGPKVLSLQHDALRYEPDNPRVLYIIGAGYLRAPKMLRNVSKAREFLERAERFFEQVPPDAPQWGRAECYGLLGELYQEEGDLPRARRCYQSALEINPDYTPAQRGLKEMAK
jgi:tetratricopeptide (TPR) repeat protein